MVVIGFGKELDAELIGEILGRVGGFVGFAFLEGGVVVAETSTAGRGFG